MKLSIRGVNEPRGCAAWLAGGKALLVLLGCWMTALTPLQGAPLAHTYRADDGAISQLDSGVVTTGRGINGALLSGSLAPTTAGAPPIPVAARIQANGQPRWGLSTKVLAQGEFASIHALVDNLRRARVHYKPNDAVHRFGIVDAPRRTPVFAHQYRAAAREDFVSVQSVVPRDHTVLARSAPGRISATVFTSDGSKLFDKNYLSDRFKGEDEANSQVQFFYFSQPPGRREYHFDTSVSTLAGGALLPSWEVNCIHTRLDDRGRVKWSRRYRLRGPQAFPQFCLGFPGPDGAAMFIHQNQATQTTQIVRIAPNGRLAWAKTYQGAVLTSINGPADREDKQHLWLAGVQNDSEPSSTVLLRINTANGNINRQARWVSNRAGGVAAFGNLIRVTNRHLYFLTLVLRPDVDAGPPTPLQLEVIRANRNLTGAVGYRSPVLYGAAISEAKNGRFLVSDFDPETGRLRAFEVNANLRALDSACPSFRRFEVERENPGVTASRFGVNLRSHQVRMRAANTKLTAAKLPVRRLQLTTGGCGA